MLGGKRLRNFQVLIENNSNICEKKGYSAFVPELVALKTEKCATFISLHCKRYTDLFSRSCLLLECRQGQGICEEISKLELFLNIMKDDRNN